MEFMLLAVHPLSTLSLRRNSGVTDRQATCRDCTNYNSFTLLFNGCACLLRCTDSLFRTCKSVCADSKICDEDHMQKCRVLMLWIRRWYEESHQMLSYLCVCALSLHYRLVQLSTESLLLCQTFWHEHKTRSEPDIFIHLSATTHLHRCQWHLKAVDGPLLPEANNTPRLRLNVEIHLTIEFFKSLL